MRKVIITAIAACAALLPLSSATAQGFPDKPITIYTGNPGGPNDFVSRLIAEGMTANLGVQVSVENLKGGRAAAEFVRDAAPDGLSVLTIGSTLWLSPYFRKNVAWDPIKDFEPLMITSMAPNILVANPALAAGSVEELLALAKSEPGKIASATGPVGSATYLGLELFKSLTGADIASTSYDGNSPAIKSVVGGETQIMFATAGAAQPHLETGALKAIAVTSENPSILRPDLPSIAGSGVPGYESVQITAMLVPAGTSPEVVAKLNAEIARVLTSEASAKALNAFGVEVVASSPDFLASKMASEMDRLGALLTAATAATN